ncbi:hypothetical protein 015DV002_128 [Bacillus phage 015DV002]|nr:hypothetical protein 015DV002_128 [Bacillus phage 015DV002]QQO41362.1 hypothetical protein 015DV004_147 [Bacillus phage 015DV004]
MKDSKLYICFLNGKPYGKGDLEYMLELFKDYVVTCEMYGKARCDFTVVSLDEWKKVKSKAVNGKYSKALQALADGEWEDE